MHARVQELWKNSHKTQKTIYNRFTHVGTGKNIPNRIDIGLRDKLANERKDFGYFEADSVVSCVEKGKTKSCLTVLLDRATRINKILNTKSYFCKPYQSWEKGTVENINGLIIDRWKSSIK